MSRIIQQPKKTLLQFPGLWLPSSPLPGALGFARRCCCGGGSDCLRCESGTAPQQIEVVITGVTNNFCSDCDDWNDTWILDFVTISADDLCRWEYIIDPTSCSATFIDGRILNVGGNAQFIIAFRSPPTVLQGSWKSNVVGSPIDCSDLAALSFSAQPIGFPCNEDSSTCVVTSLP